MAGFESVVSGSGGVVTLELTSQELALLGRGLGVALQAEIPEEERQALRGLLAKVFQGAVHGAGVRNAAE